VIAVGIDYLSRQLYHCARCEVSRPNERNLSHASKNSGVLQSLVKVGGEIFRYFGAQSIRVGIRLLVMRVVSLKK